MSKKTTDTPMEEVSKLAWDEMDEGGRNLITSVEGIKKRCLHLVEDQFVQQYHDVGEELVGLVERCGGHPYTGVSGGDELARVVIEICDKYLGGNESTKPNMKELPRYKRGRNLITTEKIKVTSTLSKMVAEIEYEIVVPLDREMTDEEKHEWIDRYLERPEVVARIYQPGNFTTFSWDDEQLDWEPVSPTKEVM